MDRQLHAITSLAIKAGFHREFIKPLPQPHSVLIQICTILIFLGIQTDKSNETIQETLFTVQRLLNYVSELPEVSLPELFKSHLWFVYYM